MHRGQAGRAVDDDREEGDQKSHQNFWKQAVAEPDKEQWRDRDLRHKLRHQKERHDDVAHLWNRDNDGSRNDPEHDREQEPGSGLVKRHPGVSEIELALLIQP